VRSAYRSVAQSWFRLAVQEYVRPWHVCHRRTYYLHLCSATGTKCCASRCIRHRKGNFHNCSCALRTVTAGATGWGRWRGRRAVGLADGHFPSVLVTMVTVLRGVGQEGGDIEKRFQCAVVLRTSKTWRLERERRQSRRQGVEMESNWLFDKQRSNNWLRVAASNLASPSPCRAEPLQPTMRFPQIFGLLAWA